MKYLVLCIFVPMIVSYIIQSALCHKLKKGMLRHGALVLPAIFIACGVVTLLSQSGDIFGGLAAIAAAFWFVIACCSAFGYGAAWLVYLMAKKGKNRAKEGGL